MKTVVINPKQLSFCGRIFHCVFHRVFRCGFCRTFRRIFFAALFATSFTGLVPVNCRAGESPLMPQQGVNVHEERHYNFTLRNIPSWGRGQICLKHTACHIHCFMEHTCHTHCTPSHQSNSRNRNKKKRSTIFGFFAALFALRTLSPDGGHFI